MSEKAKHDKLFYFNLTCYVTDDSGWVSLDKFSTSVNEFCKLE